MNISGGWLVVLLLGGGFGLWYLAREAAEKHGPVTQAEQTAQILNSVANVVQAGTKAYTDVLGTKGSSS